MTDLQIKPGQTTGAANDTPYLIVSSDDHAGPRPSQLLREYCPKEYLDEFDAAGRIQDQLAAEHADVIAKARERIAAGNPTIGDLSLDLHGTCRECEGQHDPHVRLRDMDGDGVAAQVIFAGGQNDADLPWAGLPWNAGPAGVAPEMRAVAYRMWNQWIADHISVAPERLLGVIQVPIWDIDAAVNEVEWGAAHGLHVVNLPAPRDDYLPYTHAEYDPLWAACQAAGATLATHAGASAPYGADTPQGDLLFLAEFHWYGNRGLPQLIFGGVFERFPGLKFVITEQRVDFAPMMIKHLDSIYDNLTAKDELASSEPRGGILTHALVAFKDNVLSSHPGAKNSLPRRPSEYWHEHCFLSGSFLAPFEVALRHEVGLGNLMWGSDYPHTEGTWPDTRLALRNTFAGVPFDEARMILGENAIGVYNLDAAALRKVADRIGPRPQDLVTPLKPEEFPAGRSWAFRAEANFT